MDSRDYYARLGVPRNADPETIKRAYYALARRHHPDRNQNDPEAERTFKAINEAYAVLSDVGKRRLYDRFGEQWQQAQSGGGLFDWASWFDQEASSGQPAPESDPDATDPCPEFSRRPEEGAPDASPGTDFFHQLFGAEQAAEGRVRTRQTKEPPGPEQTLPVEISLEEAFWGATRVIQQGGSRYEVTIPKGVASGSKVRIAAHQGGSDLVLLVRVKPHGLFQRQGDDLYTQVQVALYTALLGGKVQVPTLQGAFFLAVPPNTQNGRIFRLKGQGMPRVKRPQQRGDLLVESVVELPVPLSEEERTHFLALQRLRASQ